MKIRKVDHIGIAYRNFEAPLRLWRDVLGLEFEGIVELPERGLRVAMLRAGDVLIELLSPSSDEGPLARFLERRGEGLHHVCLETGDIREALAHARAAGIPLVDEEPSTGAEGCPVAFLHPRGTHGVLIEFIER